MVELIWDGKYDKNGKRMSPPRVSLPFQTVETVNESAQQRQKMLDMFSQGRDPEWRNRLIWGDKKYVLPSLLDEFAGKVDLIYIDPPFATGADFSFAAQVGDSEFTKEPSMIEQKAYRDTWGRGLDSYLHWFSETVALLKEFLTEQGSIYVHLDWHVSHYGKAIMDEIFGPSGFQNEVIWQRTNSHNINPNYFLRIHDVILFYTVSDKYAWNVQFTEYSPEQIKRYKPDSDGRFYTGQDLTMSTASKSRNFEWRGTRPPSNRGWAAPREELERLWETGLILTKEDGTPRLDGHKVYLDEQQGKRATDLWTDIPRVGNTSQERLDYATQKPEALLERIIKTSSNEGDLVLDCFCGSGTTAAVAEKLNRKWITCDLGRFAIHTARKRLLSIEGVRPFVVQNLGKYERQVWQKAEFGEHAEATIHAYRKFILDLYHAEAITGFIWLHGRKAGRLVHVGTVDAPVSDGEIRQIAIEFRKAIGSGLGAPKVAGIDILGWDFALDTNETKAQIAHEAGLDVRFIRIPREVLEQKAVDQGDIRFFELAALSVETYRKGQVVKVELTDFMVSPDDVPDDVIKAVNKWSEWIDYWAVDFNFRGDTFHNEWQSYRTRKDRSLELSVSHTYEQSGKYTILVKVIDILGNDTTKAIQVEVE